MDPISLWFFPLRLVLATQDACAKLVMQSANEFRSRFAALPDPLTAYAARLSAHDE